MALLQRSSFINRVLFQPIPEGARAAVIPAADFAFRKLHALQHRAAPLSTDLASEKIICERHGFICYTVPKAGSSSLIRLLEPHGGKVLSITVDELFRRAPSCAAMPGFAILRNPWARALSAYRDKLVNVSNLGKLRIVTRYKGLRPGMSFAAFVEWLETEEGSDAFADRHWVSQWRLLSGAQGRSPVTITGRLEAMDADVSRILSGFGIKVPEVPHDNKRKHPLPNGYREFYTPDLKRAVARRYARDIELYGYEF